MQVQESTTIKSYLSLLTQCAWPAPKNNTAITNARALKHVKVICHIKTGMEQHYCAVNLTHPMGIEKFIVHMILNMHARKLLPNWIHSAWRGELNDAVGPTL